jgi:hypothetical protein
MFGKLRHQFVPIKHWLSGARHDVLKGSKWLGKQVRDTRGVWTSGKHLLRAASDSADKALGTGHALHSIADRAIHSLGTSLPGQLAATGLDEIDFQNKRLQSGLHSGLVKGALGS